MICDVLDELEPNSKIGERRSLIKFVEDRPGHDRRYAMDVEKIKSELDWQPRHSLSDGLLETIKWYLAQEDWISEIRKQQDYQSWLDKNYIERLEGK